MCFSSAANGFASISMLRPSRARPPRVHDAPKMMRSEKKTRRNVLHPSAARGVSIWGWVAERRNRPRSDPDLPRASWLRAALPTKVYRHPNVSTSFPERCAPKHLTTRVPCSIIPPTSFLFLRRPNVLGRVDKPRADDGDYVALTNIALDLPLGQKATRACCTKSR